MRNLRLRREIFKQYGKIMKHSNFQLRAFLTAHKEIIIYLVFGVCTTVINAASYWVLYDVLSIGNIVSTVLAWLLSVIFAYATNKVFVFESKRTSAAARFKEAASFFSCRVLTGVLDVVIMAIAVDLLHGYGPLWKLLSNVIVIVVNYVASKFVIFKK